MAQPNFILLNGFAGAGKSTIARRYIADHPLALVIEGDELIVNLGSWLEREGEARELVYEMIKSLLTIHLSKGYDVVLPYLVADNRHIKEFESIAANANATFHNFLLFNEKEVAVQRLLERGTWGEAGTDLLSEKDIPEIEKLYDAMERQLEHQDRVVVIDQSSLSIDETYQAIASAMIKR
jgi:predicted kinase